MQTDILDRGPDNREATTLRGEHIDLLGALPHITEQAFNGIGGLNVSVHGLRELVKRQEVLFILSQASHRFWIALAILGFDGGQLDQGLRLCRLLLDAHEFSLNFSTLSSGDSIEDVALLVHQTALTRGGGKQFPNGCQQSIMAVGDDQIDVGGSSCA